MISLVRKRYPDGRVPAQQFKIQFARMGEPSFNLDVLDVLEELPTRYAAPGFMPSISTIAPRGADRFFERLREIKRSNFSGGHFQFQFSIHTTDQKLRDQIIPVKKWRFARMAAYGLPLVPASILNWSLVAINRYYLNAYAGAETVGYYSLASNISPGNVVGRLIVYPGEAAFHAC